VNPLYVPYQVRPRRPVGVIILTILQIFSGIGDILLGILLLVAYAVINALLGPVLLAVAFLSLSIVAFSLGIFSFVLAYGLWSGKGWAWGLSIIGAIIGLALGALGLAFGGLTIEGLTNLIPITLSVLVLAYLNTSNVRAFFGRAGGVTVVRPVMPTAGGPPFMPLTQSPYPQPAAQQPYYPQPSPWPVSSCPNCGTPVQSGVNFCDGCGTRLR
jgi:hypothetical protein